MGEEEVVLVAVVVAGEDEIAFCIVKVVCTDFAVCVCVRVRACVRACVYVSAWVCVHAWLSTRHPQSIGVTVNPLAHSLWFALGPIAMSAPTATFAPSQLAS